MADPPRQSTMQTAATEPFPPVSASPEPMPAVGTTSPEAMPTPPARAGTSGTSTSFSFGRRNRSGTASSSSTAGGLLRAASLKILDSPVPAGMWAATGEAAAARLPSVRDIRSGGADGTWRQAAAVRRASQEGSIRLQRTRTAELEGKERTGSGEGAAEASARPIHEEDEGPPDVDFGRGKMTNQTAVKSLGPGHSATADLDSNASDSDDPKPQRHSKNLAAMFGESPDTGKPLAPPLSKEPGPNGAATTAPVPDEHGVYPNGYVFPAKKTWKESWRIGFRAFLRFTFTIQGFLIVLYGLNVVAWGGMLFLLLCNAGPAMCQLGDGRTDCNDIDSPRRVWVEIDSQILNALFCVTGFGLIPWRFRDLYYLLKFRLAKNYDGLRKLAGYHRSWFRLPGSDRLPVIPRDERHATDDEDDMDPLDTEQLKAVPVPRKRAPDQPLTGARAAPTALWKMDFVVWAFVWNTFLQVVLSVFMWSMNRYVRPSWSTGLFVALASIVAGMGGLMQFFEGKKVKKVEGVPVSTEDLVRDAEKGETVERVKAEKTGGGSPSKWEGPFTGKSRTESGI